MGIRLFVTLVALVMFALPGCIALWVSLFTSSWFYRSQMPQYFISRWGMRGTRLFYALLGLLLISAAILIISDPRGLIEKAEMARIGIR